MSTPIPPHIRTYLEGLMREAGMTDLDTEQHEERLRELFVRLDQFLDTAIGKNLAVPFDTFLRQVFIDFRRQYLGGNEQKSG